MRTKIAIASLVLILSAALTYGSADKRIHRILDLNSGGHLSLTTHNGTVTITTWNQPRVDIDARIEPGDSDYPEDVDKTDVRISGSGSSVSIESDYDRLPWHHSWLGFTDHVLPLIHYTISMPATASLDVNDHNADVRVTGLRNDLT